MNIFFANNKQTSFFLKKYQAIRATDDPKNKTYFVKNNKVYFNLGSIETHQNLVSSDTTDYDSNVIHQNVRESINENITKHIINFSNGRLVFVKVSDYV